MKKPLCHFLVKKVAQEICGEFYHLSCKSSDVFYRKNPNERAFIRKYWGGFLASARSVMVDMLASQELSDTLKEEIHDALLKDKSLPREGSFIN